MGRYYEIKFLVLVWLMFFEGADKIYRSVRYGLKWLGRLFPKLFPKKPEMTEEVRTRRPSQNHHAATSQQSRSSLVAMT